MWRQDIIFLIAFFNKFNISRWSISKNDAFLTKMDYLDHYWSDNLEITLN